MNAVAEPESFFLDAFEAFGIEIEYMIVDAGSLSVMAAADRMLGEGGEIERRELSWTNELVAHVIELKNSRPTRFLTDLPEALQDAVREMNGMLRGHGARLMPTAMHPWMDPPRETRLWPYGSREIYQAYDSVFDCSGHGWANLQSMHINLPFGDDEEFARLHAAIRLVLPILPAIAASSPITDGSPAGWLDYRMEVYRNNAAAIPSITGQIIPETASSRADYEARILQPMYCAIAPFDPDGILQHEWLNSRGAIARFDRGAIEIRVLDVQECPSADIAIAAATIDLVWTLYQARQAPLASQQAIATDALAEVLLACMRDGEEAVIARADYLALLGYPAQRCTGTELWHYLADSMLSAGTAHCSLWTRPLSGILEHGPLARRILHAVDGDYSRPHLRSIYTMLCRCLDDGTMFLPD